jgi:hypothetical protein
VEKVMPIHDWTRVDAGIFHDFHHGWIAEIKRALNRGLLPSNCYALSAEQTAGGLESDVLTLQRPTNGASTAEPDLYAAKAKAVVIRHVSDHRIIAIAEIVSPGNKNSRHGLRAFVNKAVELLRAGVHLLIVDLSARPPGHPQGRLGRVHR